MLPSARSTNQKERVRKLLDGLQIDSFKAFCLDRCGEVYGKFAGAMNRTQCINLLLESIDADEVLLALCSRFPSIREQVHRESERTVWSALTGLDRVAQWQSLVGSIPARPRLNRLVVVHAQTKQHLELFVERMELHLREAVSCALVKVPCRYRGTTAKTGLGWDKHLRVQLADMAQRDAATVDVPTLLREETQQRPLVLTLLYADVPRQVLRDSHSMLTSGLRDFLAETLPTLLLGVGRVTVIVPVEHEQSTNALLDLCKDPAVQKVWDRPEKQRELAILDELRFPSWRDIQLHFGECPDPIPNLDDILTRLKPLYEKLKLEHASYKELAEAIEDTIALSE